MIKDIKNLFIKNFNTIFKFELIFKLVTLFIAMPLFLELFKLTMKISGYSYLTIENILKFLINPITLVLLLILLLIIAFYTIFDIGTIIIIFDASKQNKKIKLFDIIKISFKKSVKVFKIQNIWLIVFVLFLIPFFNIGMATNVISTIKIPEFIMDFIYANWVYTILFVTVIILLTIILLKWMYTLHYFFLEDKSTMQAQKASSNLSKKSHIKDLINVLIPQLLISLLFFICTLIGIGIIILIHKLFLKIALLDAFLMSLIETFIAISVIIFYIINISIGYSCISILFYKHKNNANEEIQHIELNEKESGKNKLYVNIIMVSIIILSIIGFTFINYNFVKGNYNFNIEYIRNIEISAHRGDSVNYPENTMSAFIGAKNNGAKWIELDIQQSKDEKIFVSHDSNFKRVSGMDLNSWEATYNEISQLDVGSFKDEQFKGEKIPLLEDVIDWAKENNIKLNIEIKPTGYEKNFEKQVIELIYNKGFENDCVIASQKYSVLENVKEIDERIPTVYVMSIAIGDILKFDKADSFSLEATNITTQKVDEIHNKGKKVYAWTINTEESITQMINCNVDNIISDNIVLAQEVLFKSKKSNVLIELIDFVENLFER